jgi:hypothetical protein
MTSAVAKADEPSTTPDPVDRRDASGPDARVGLSVAEAIRLVGPPDSAAERSAV